MKKRITFFFVSALCCSTILLTGCLNTTLMSMGTQPIPLVHQPRQNMDKSKPEIGISADGFGIINGHWVNTHQIYGGGGIINGTIYGAKPISPFFINFSFGGYGGNVKFTCDEEENCRDKYFDWLDSDEGKKTYSFFAFQEKISLGIEFNPWRFILGLSAGMHAFEGGGDYDNQRKELADLPNVVNESDNGANFIFSSWLGFQIGEDGKYGAVVSELQLSGLYAHDESAEGQASLSYFHPSGFHGGITFVRTPGIELFAGKTFYF